MLKITNLHARLEEDADVKILKGFDIEIKAGEVHAIMGPNGSGKTTLSQVVAGREDYEVTDGTIFFEGEDVAEWEPEERAHKGLFLSFQHPLEIPGVTVMTFLRTAVNALRAARGQEALNAAQFLRLVREKGGELNIKDDMLKRHLNVGFSGGEKKRLEILQMTLMEPRLAILDETDSGLDIDALKLVSEGVNRMRDGNRAFLVITHYQRLLDHIKPDVVHIMAGGRIVRTGGPELAGELEASGYDDVIAKAA